MNKTLYRLLIRTVPEPRLRLTSWTGFSVSPALAEQFTRILERERVRGGVLALMNARGEYTSAAFGQARMGEDCPAAPEHYFRCASISKFASAAGTLRLADAGKIGLDRDISDYLGYLVRHPNAPGRAITLRLLLAHRAGLRDGASYQAALAQPCPLRELLTADNFTEHKPDEGFEYSNFGAGLAGAVLEAALGRPFDDLMREALFEPAGVSATFHPQRAQGLLADAWRLMPPSRTPNYDAKKRAAQPLPSMDPDMDYLSAHGGLCATAEGLLRLAAFTVRDPACAPMRVPLSSFGQRDRCLQEGLGCFIYQDPALRFPLYGHQGLAYGSVHGLFFRADTELSGFALLTSAASEQREGVMTALNRDIARAVYGESD